MELCPNCAAEVSENADRCPACGLPRNLPVHAADGTVLGHTFNTVGSYGVGSTSPSPPFTDPPPPSSPPPSARSRSRLAMILVPILVGALVLGVATALVIRAVRGDGPIAGPASTAAPPSSEAPTTTPPTTTAPTTAPPSSTAPPTTAPPVDRDALLAKSSSGVVGVLATGCSAGDENPRATGFQVSATEVVTTWAAVSGAISLVVLDPKGDPVPATVDRVDPDHGVAVLKTSRALGGHEFDLADAELLAGATAYGLAADLLYGSAPELTELVVGEVADHRAPTDLAIDGRVPGGPVVDADGDVIGIEVHDDSSALLIDATVIQQALDADDHPDTDCSTIRGPQGPLPLKEGTNNTLESYFAGINSGDHEEVWGLLAPSVRGNKKDTLDGWKSVYDFNIRIDRVATDRYRVQFDSIFSQGQGPTPDLTCARWTLTYRIADGKIAAAAPDKGSPGHRTC